MRTVFFFSSRRRHTRYWRDWSSDVCSSDLEDFRREGRSEAHRAIEWWASLVTSLRPSLRSEERRVGKECSLRGWTDHPETNNSRTRSWTTGDLPATSFDCGRSV